MDKFRSLLPLLAVIFAGIAVFETGVRYGATNMRAYAIAGELQMPLTIYTQGKANLDPQSVSELLIVIDNGIAAGSVHRSLWYLDAEAKAALDQILKRAFLIRGDGTEQRLDSMQPNERIETLKAAVTLARTELLKSNDLSPGEEIAEARN